MSKILFDQTGKKKYETGVSDCALFLMNSVGKYVNGVAWNGITSIQESPSGAEANAVYADNIKYLNLMSAEDFGATVEAYTYPDEFEACDGSVEIAPGVTIGQQDRTVFGLAYKTLVGNDVKSNNYGYKLHIVYGCMASPSEKEYKSVNDSPEAISFSWEIKTTPVVVPGFKPTATVVIDSTKCDKDKLKALEDVIYGTDAVGETEGTEPRLPFPDEIKTVMQGGTVTPDAPPVNNFMIAPNSMIDDIVNQY